MPKPCCILSKTILLPALACLSMAAAVSMHQTAKFKIGAGLLLTIAQLLVADVSCHVAQADEPVSSPETTLQRETRLQWWREARFGMFIHWGPISLKGTEISWSRAGPRQGCPSKSVGTVPVEEYDNLYKQFNPTQFDADRWVNIAEQAGMKYMVLTAKHCDGFCLWNSQVSDYNISHTPFGRDICGELAQTAHRHGMHLGWYYSPMDWRDPDCRTDPNAKYVASMQRQLGELLGNYGPIDLLWFDFDSGSVPWDQPQTYGVFVNCNRRSSSTIGWTWQLIASIRKTKSDRMPLLHAGTEDRQV